MIEEATVFKELKSHLIRQGYQELPTGRWKRIPDLLMKRKTVTISRELMDKINLDKTNLAEFSTSWKGVIHHARIMGEEH